MQLAESLMITSSLFAGGAMVDLDQRPSTVDAVFSLLREGLNAMEENRASAAICFKRAYALIEGERDRPGASSVETTRGGLAPWQVRQALSFIDTNLSQPIMMADLSLMARLSPRYFARAFKRTIGETLHDYVYRRRIEKAQNLMLTTDEALCQIALACGFADQAHFTRRFRQSTGQTPYAWRRALLGSYRTADQD